MTDVDRLKLVEDIDNKGIKLAEWERAFIYDVLFYERHKTGKISMTKDRRLIIDGMKERYRRELGDE